MKINSASEWLSQSKYGEHSMLVYSSLEEFREIYSDHCKLALEKDNELVLLIPHYETVNSVRETLKKINASKYEVEGTLVIVDTENAFQKSNDVYNILLMINLLTKRVASLGKNGLSMIADAGSFFLHEKLEELVKHELSVPPDLEMKCKASCCYHKKDFEKLGTRQKKTLLDHHNRKVIL